MLVQYIHPLQDGWLSLHTRRIVNGTVRPANRLLSPPLELFSWQRER